ncbi:MAG: homoserine kinase [Thiolinea sp.]
MSVFTAVSAPQLDQFLQGYRVGARLTHAGIAAGVENSNFFVTTARGEFVLTLFEKHTADELDFFLTLMTFLAEAGVPVARPVPDARSALLNQLNGKPAALIARLPGTAPLIPDVQHCAEMGAMLARIHQAAAGFKPYRAPDRGHVWRVQTARRLLSAGILDERDHQLLQTELRFQEHLPLAGLPQGIIHADLFRDNTLFVEGRLTGIIDWYYACVDSWLYDLAIVVNDWCCDEQGQLRWEHLQACMQGYHAVRPLTAAEAACWAGMLRAAALRFWLSRLLDVLYPRPGEQVLQKDPAEFRIKLQARIAESARLEQMFPSAV